MAGGDEIEEAAAQIKDMSMEELVKTLLRSVQQNADLIRRLNDRAEAPSAEAIRAEKLSKLNLALRKSSKIKEYKDTQEMNIKEWLKKYEEEILVLKRMSGIDDDLTSDEKVLMLKDKLDYHVIKRVDTAFRNKGHEWDTVTYVDLSKLL